MTSRRRQRSPATIGAAGFTLIEMLVVVAIMAVSLVLIVGYKPPWSQGFDIETTAAELAGELRLVRSEAIAENRAVALQIDLAHHLYRAGTAPPRPLPAGLAIQLLTIAGEQQGKRSGDIRFNPDGSSTGGRIVLAYGPRRVAVGVDWLTGRVSVAGVR
ncbi:MAG TPA: GspH/FimT family pseudopilin [Stellaceae bacterium]|nr:GspH/FimT family pseudopilin [Stellaceae bacterium]